jgi:energy-coupling factor transporter transmembrane protein EcfT
VIAERLHGAGRRGLHRVGPLGNLLILAGFLVVALASGSVAVKAGAAAGIFGLAWASGEPPRRFVRSLRFVLWFGAFLFGAQALSVRDGAILFRVGVPITAEGLLAGAQMTLRFLVILTASFLFALVTDPDRLAHTLIRFGVPYRHGYALILALRFVPFFRRELAVVREAQHLRGIRPSVRSLAGVRQAVRYTFVPVIVAALTRVDSIAMSMKGRAFGLHARRTPMQGRLWTPGDAAAWAVFAASIVLSVLSRRWAWF